MSIEDLDTKQDLERFVRDFVEQQPMNIIRGLPTTLAAGVAIDVGQVPFNFAAGQAVSPEITIAHRLSLEPRFCAFEQIGGPSGRLNFLLISRDKDNVVFVVERGGALIEPLAVMIEWAVFRGGVV